MHLRRRRDGDGHLLGEETHFVPRCWGGAVEAVGVGFVEPVGEEFFDCAGLEDGAGEDVGAYLAGFFEEDDSELFVSCLCS
jgi:hypothetical protein